jgi:hypothetical protein
MSLVTRMAELQASVGTNGILECEYLSKTCTVQQSQPDGPSPNAAESRVKTRTVHEPRDVNLGGNCWHLGCDGGIHHLLAATGLDQSHLVGHSDADADSG